MVETSSKPGRGRIYGSITDTIGNTPLVVLCAAAISLPPAQPGHGQEHGNPPVVRALPLDPTDDVRTQVEIPRGSKRKRGTKALPDPDVIPEGKPVPKDGTIPEGRAVPATPTDKQKKTETAPLTASMRTQADARTLFLTLPAPRGQIVDRNGVPIAQNIIGFYPGIEFPHGQPMAPNDVLRYTQARLLHTSKALGIEWVVKSDVVLEHYQNRRWLPLLSTTVLKDIIPAEVQKRLAPGVVLHPAYLRTYPNGPSACHFLGSVGKVRPMPTGPVDPLDPFYPEMVGRDGIERAYNAQLTGKPGQINILFDPAGNKIIEEITQKPVPGHNVITTIDADFQKICEDVLKNDVKRGAFVIVDVWDGDVIAMASWPMFNPNLWVPSVNEKEFSRLNGDKDKPLRGRAFMDIYPPASTFKVVTALAGLDSGKITESTTYNCSSGILIGNRWFHNWNKHDEGPLDLIDAIKRSCNTWFYRCGQAVGARDLALMATRLGFGERTGLPIRGEAAGHVATDEWMQRYQGRRIMGGDLASMSIGQGPVSATPIQVARAMAAIANGEYVPELRLVKQVQDLQNNVVEAFPPAKHNELKIDRDHIKSVQEGMRAVVQEDGGTGRAAANDFVTVAGKTGTAQWERDRNMAWFAGFLPAKNPQYAFAAIYEGDVGEDSISGGRKVAPMVGEVFTRIYKLKKEREEPLAGRSPTLAKNEKAEDADSEAEDEEADARKQRRAAVAQVPTVKRADPVLPVASPPRESGIRGFFKRLFKGR